MKPLRCTTGHPLDIRLSLGKIIQPLVRLLTDGQQQLFVATSALGLGIDRGSIRHVFFLGQIRRLRDLVQQSGRAGRDGAPSKATIIRGALYAPNGKRRIGGRFGDVEAEVHELIQGDGCIRVVMDREMDGHERLMCKGGEEACSRCWEKQVFEEGEETIDNRHEQDKFVQCRRCRGRRCPVRWQLAWAGGTNLRV